MMLAKHFAVRALDFQPRSPAHPFPSTPFSSSRSSERNAVDAFLFAAAWDAHQRELVKTWLIFHGQMIAGYFALSAAQEDLDFLPDAERIQFQGESYNFEYEGNDVARSVRRRILPCVYINYFGVDREYQGKVLADGGVKVSDFMFRAALDMAVRASDLIGASIVSLDAVNATGVLKFYADHGFRHAKSAPDSNPDTRGMFLPMTHLKKAASLAARP
jgi:GNAT superfamily N-acetyltransferase